MFAVRDAASKPCSYRKTFLQHMRYRGCDAAAHNAGGEATVRVTFQLHVRGDCLGRSPPLSWTVSRSC